MIRSGLGRDAVILACAISAGIHAALVPHHLEHRAAAGAGFLAAAVLLAVVAIALTFRPASVAYVAATVVLAGLLVSYALAVTSGVPFVHPEPEPLDWLALATKAVEAVGLGLALRLVGPVPFPIRTEGVRT